MRRLVFAAVLPFVIFSCAPPLVPGDKWVHCLVSTCIVPAGARLATGAGMDDGTAVACGMALSAFLGVVKEYSDSRAGRGFDWYDLLADLTGISAGAAVCCMTMEE